MATTSATGTPSTSIEAASPSPTAATHVAFLGLGVMGGPMARHLATAGHNVTVYNRTAAKAEAWVEANRSSGANVAMASTPALASTGAQIVFMCVGNDADLRSVVLGADGALAAMAAGSVLVDHTTASADVARELHAACAARGIGFIDAPVSGGQAGAENGGLTVMCGGDQADFDRVAPVISAFAKSCRLLGPTGSGQLTKMVNQICIAGMVQGLAEGVAFAQKAGLNVDDVIDVISKGAAASWQMDNRARTMAAGEFEFGFAVEWMRKDLGIVLDEARRNGARVPVAALVDQFYSQVIARGGARWDTSALAHLLQNE
jgi:3-hydroxyisobutyrate dehydrogenase-like beta-hydroxyacid dehydrogenase